MEKLYSISIKISAVMLLWMLLFTKTNAQLRITAPVENQVTQRDQGGWGRLALSVYAGYPYERVRAVLTPIENNPRSQREFDFDQGQMQQGLLTGEMQAETGWYRLTITGTSASRTDSSIVARIGIGEVFLVVGNSNAMGLPELGAKSASSYVISFNAVNKALNADNITVAPDEPMPAPQFTPLEKDSYIFPSGETAWYWGELGDLISQRWQTPVLFFNAAWAAANSDNYRDAANGKDAFNMYVGKNWPNRQPYTNVLNAMRYLTSWTGVRSVLFSHGENDAELKFTEDNYFNNIRTLIETSRRDAGYETPWIIARNSASYRVPDPVFPILNAQNRLAEIGGFNTYKGPYMDTVQLPRQPHGHFENVPGGSQGLTLAAQAWFRSLTELPVDQIRPWQPNFRMATGVVPSRAFPGAAFPLAYRADGSLPGNFSVQAELLDSEGKFIAIVGRGADNPLAVQLPGDLKNGNYRLRISSSSPVQPGSLSELFEVNAQHRDIDFVSSFSARVAESNVHVSWLIAPMENSSRVVLQKTSDGTNYTDVATFEVPAGRSVVERYVDTELGSGTVFYRLKFENSINARMAVVFREGAPQAFTVFPNPVVQQVFYFRLNADQQVACKLFDLRGREHPVSFSDREIEDLGVVRPISSLPAGTYILQITADGQTVSQRIAFW